MADKTKKLISDDACVSNVAVEDDMGLVIISNGVESNGNRVTVRTAEGKTLGEFLPNTAIVFARDATTIVTKMRFHEDGATPKDWDDFREGMRVANGRVLTNDIAPKFIRDKLAPVGSARLRAALSIRA